MKSEAEPTTYLLKKTISLFQVNKKQKDLHLGTAKRYDKIRLKQKWYN